MVLKKWWIRRKINKWQMKHYSHPIDYSYEKSLEFSESNDKNDLEELTVNILTSKKFRQFLCKKKFIQVSGMKATI